MKQKMKNSWQRVPASIRKPIVLVVGSFFVIAAALTGWLPGPGGIPLFLIGIAILSTEYEWAKRFRDFILGIVYGVGRWLRRHPIIMTLFIAGTILTLSFSIYLLYRFFKH